MALNDTQFAALKEQLQKKKDKLGEEEYSNFTNRARGVHSPKQEEATADSNVPFPATGEESGFEAGTKAVGNLPSSVFSFGSNIASAAASPVETGKGLLSLIVGAGGQIQNLLSSGVEKATGKENFGRFENEGAQQTFDTVVDSLKERYGTLENAQKTAIEDPFGVGADIVGALSGTKVLGVIDDINRTAKASLSAKISAKTDDIAIGQMQKAINLNPSDIRKIKQPNIAGTDPAEWLVRRDFQGSQESIVSKLDDYRRSTKATVDNGLDAIPTQIDASQVVPAQQTLQVLKNTFEGTVGNETLVKSLDDLLAKETYTLSELNSIKRLADAELNIFKSTGALKESATAKGLFNVRDELKVSIEKIASENGFDSVKQLNKETQVARAISDAMKKRIEVSSKLPELGLTDWVVAGGGLASGNVLPAAGVLIGKQALQSAQFRTFMAKRLRQASPEEVTQINKSIQSGNRMELLQVLAPIINEYQTSVEDQTQNTEQLQ